ncbi:MAG: hypothetical protein IT184_02990 [Acidobacteria bacterium]|nr:hypothetical protein [Acidobacteriota bacterium]
MRLAFDLDGVLADLHGAYARAARALYPDLDPAALASPSTGASPPPDERDTPKEAPEVEVDSRPALTRQQSHLVWKHMCAQPNFWETLDEIEPGAVARLYELSAARRWEVIFLTSRPFAPGDTLQRQTQRWLERCGFRLPSVFIVQQARGRIADALELDVVVDDRPEGCLDVVLESKARGILVWRGEPSTVPGSAKRLGIGVVPSVATCLDVLVRADDETADDGLMARLRRLLGLKTARP